MTSPMWDMQETRTMVRRRVSGVDFERAHRSLASTIDRREYARLHFHEIKSRWAELLGVAATPTGIWDIVLGGTSEADIEDANEADLLNIGAHTIACVQSLHAIPDIFAHGLYYSLGLTKMASLKERKITAVSVHDLLLKNSACGSLAGHLSDLYSTGDFAHLAALSNHGKHRSIVKNSLAADMSAVDPEPLRLHFDAFEYSGASYDQREVLPLLQAEFDRMSKIVVDGGVELNRVLKLTLG